MTGLLNPIQIFGNRATRGGYYGLDFSADYRSNSTGISTTVNFGTRLTMYLK